MNYGTDIRVRMPIPNRGVEPLYVIMSFDPDELGG